MRKEEAPPGKGQWSAVTHSTDGPYWTCEMLMGEAGKNEFVSPERLIEVYRADGGITTPTHFVYEQWVGYRRSKRQPDGWLRHLRPVKEYMLVDGKWVTRYIQPDGNLTRPSISPSEAGAA